MKALLGLVSLLMTVCIAQAGVVQPYTTDAHTLHLWHLDGVSNALSDSAGSVGLYNWGTKGTFAVNSVGNLNKAYQSTSGITNSDLQANGNISWNSTMMGATGAFTWEMVLRPDTAATANTGNQMLLAGASQIQLKLNYAASGLFLALYNNTQGTLLNTRLDAPMTLGANSYATNEWFHLAVAYDGTSQAKVYWTAIGTNYTGTANLLATVNMADLSLTDTTLSFGGVANNAGSTFKGAIDEIRISDIARNSSEFLAIPEPATLSLFMISGSCLFIARKHLRR